MKIVSLILLVLAMSIQSYSQSELKSLTGTIYFDSNGDTLTKESRKVLDSLMMVVLEHNQYVVIRVNSAGHTDLSGSNVYNENLSHRRAEKVNGYFRNFTCSRYLEFNCYGFGETQPNSETDDAENRRVEVELVLERVNDRLVSDFEEGKWVDP